MKKWGFLALFSVLVFFSCGEKKSIEDTALKVNAEGAIQLSVQNAQSDSEHSWNLSERKIFFLRNMNEPQDLSRYKAHISSISDCVYIHMNVLQNLIFHNGQIRMLLIFHR